MSEQILCNQCKKEITTTNYVRCFNCNSNYHLATCCPIAATLYGERKTSWRCHICKPRARSPNTLYQSVVFEDIDSNKSNNSPTNSSSANTSNKQTRNDDENIENDTAKKFKEAMSLTSVTNKLCSVQSDVTELKSDIKEVKRTMDQLINHIDQKCSDMNASNIQIKQEIQNSLVTITNTLTTLVAQVKDLSEKDKERDAQINTMETRINKLEQQMISQNIEIKNITNTQISPYEVVKAIATSMGTEITERDINKAYRLRKQKDKVIVEFSSVNKKAEFMNKIEKHRVDAKVINNNSDGQNKYIYINDELTFNNRRLLWLAKTKAKEANWKFVWVRNGNIFARKNENSPLFVINNNTDIENISTQI